MGFSIFVGFCSMFVGLVAYNLSGGSTGAQVGVSVAFLFGYTLAGWRFTR